MSAAGWALVALVVLAGCSPEDPIAALPLGQGAGGAGGSGAGGNGGTTAGTGTLVVDVMALAPGQDVAQPAVGAVVAFDLPQGHRVEQTVVADGRLTFEGVDWEAAEPGAVTAYLEGYQLVSFVGLTEDGVQALTELYGTEVLTATLVPAEAAERVVVSGLAKNMADESDYLWTRASRRSGTRRVAWSVRHTPGVGGAHHP